MDFLRATYIIERMQILRARTSNGFLNFAKTKRRVYHPYFLLACVCVCVRMNEYKAEFASNTNTPHLGSKRESRFFSFMHDYEEHSFFLSFRGANSLLRAELFRYSVTVYIIYVYEHKTRVHTQKFLLPRW